MQYKGSRAIAMAATTKGRKSLAEACFLLTIICAFTAVLAKG